MKKREYLNDKFKGSVKVKGHWQGVHKLSEAERNLGSSRKRYSWETNWADGTTDEGTSDQDDVAPAERPEVLESTRDHQ